MPLSTDKWNVGPTNNQLYVSQDGVIAWKRLLHSWSFVWGIHLWPVDSHRCFFPHKGWVLWGFGISWSGCQTIRQDAGDFRRHYALFNRHHSNGLLVISPCAPGGWIEEQRNSLNKAMSLYKLSQTELFQLHKVSMLDLMFIILFKHVFPHIPYHGRELDILLVYIIYHMLFFTHPSRYTS